MEYPHRRYIIYLLTQQLTTWELLERCRLMNLTPPNEDVLKEIRRGMGFPPIGWVGKYTRGNVAARRWLRDLGVEDLWRGSPKAVEAERICLSPDIRRDAQGLLLIHHGDGEAVRETLLLKYPERLVPSAQGIAYFGQVFWDTHSMSREGLLEYIKLSDDYERLLAAAQGDMLTALSMMGIQSHVSRKTFMQTIVSFAQQQLVAHTRASGGNPLRGNDLVGLATFARQGIEARGELDEIESAGGASDDLVEEAHRFKLRRLKSKREIVSIDDLAKIDLEDLAKGLGLQLEDEEEESNEDIGEDNVRHFPSKN